MTNFLSANSCGAKRRRKLEVFDSNSWKHESDISLMVYW